jgi:predicted Zn-ribbon and HTH transcriptional regulator
VERTRRQRIIELLTAGEWEFDELRHDLALTVKVLEEDLRHVERSVRSGGRRLIVEPARCEGCGFAFRTRALHPPGRCPSCHDRRVIGPWVRIG